MGRHDMIRHQFHIKKYWRVIVYYDLDYNYSDIINHELLRNGFDDDMLDEFWYMMTEGGGKAVTYSNLSKHLSIIIFNKHKNSTDYINSIVHEAKHVKQAMLEAYEVQDKGEESAYTIGYLVMKMYKEFRRLLNY